LIAREESSPPEPKPLQIKRRDVESRYTHLNFRFPAKFHPPVVRTLIEEFTEPGQSVLDPFVGSGTLLVEAAVAGRVAFGSDVDPLAIAVSRAKSVSLDPDNLQRIQARLLSVVAASRRSPADYSDLMHTDISPEELARESITADAPAIPNLLHWFRRYVIVDLIKIRDAVVATEMSGAEKEFFRICFAAIIRNVSNADPVPVSGLEVTKYIRARDDQGRLIDPFSQFERSVTRAIGGMREFYEQVGSSRPQWLRRVDVTRLTSALGAKVTTIITSPPYHGAVDYYRRHQLEMFWLGLTGTQTDRLALLKDYIGRPWPPSRHPWVRAKLHDPLAVATERQIREMHPRRANAFHHYCIAMERGLRQMAKALEPRGKAILVVGHSTWGKTLLNTSELFEALAQPDFKLVDTLWYPVTNRYMSYSRHNGASIDREFVLLLERRPVR
jgi:hypothetical protein